MNFYDVLDWSIWKTLAKEVKVQVISQLLMHFVSPLKKVSHVRYKEFALDGIKCQTFEFQIDGEWFVFIPGNADTILGWDAGISGIPITAWHDKLENETKQVKKIIQNYQLKTKDDWSTFINESTSPLRKKDMPAMFVQKYSQPIGTSYIGYFDLITGEFNGKNAAFQSIEKEFQAAFSAPKTFEESLTWQQPKTLYEKNNFYAALNQTKEVYEIYTHQLCSFHELKEQLNSQVYELLDEDQWEYVVGAGSRKLFRWGSMVSCDTPVQKEFVEQMIAHENMFGLLFSSQNNDWELTDSLILKGEKWERTGLSLLDLLPQASYYRSRHSFDRDEQLSPLDYVYRKAIIIRSE
jgi:hypothetical protein